MNNPSHHTATNWYQFRRLALSAGVMGALTIIGFGFLGPISRNQQASDRTPQAPLAHGIPAAAAPAQVAIKSQVYSSRELSALSERSSEANVNGVDGTLAASREITSLWDIGPHSRLLAADIRRYLQKLTQLGEVALPSIRQFLREGEDTSLRATKEGGGRRQYASLRLALFDVLRQIGGPQSESILADELLHTVDPTEVATLARCLHEVAPGGYREQLLQAAREIMDLAWQGNLPGRNMTPLFEVVRDFSDPQQAASTLKRNLWKDWGPSALVALAEIDPRAGVPLLTRMARSSIDVDHDTEELSNRRLLALHTLAQLAIENRNAREVLLEQARMDRIPDRLWSKLAEVLTGDNQLRIQKPSDDADYSVYFVGDHVIYAIRGAIAQTPEQVEARVRLVDDLSSAALSPEAHRNLDSVRDALTVRHTELAGRRK